MFDFNEPKTWVLLAFLMLFLLSFQKIAKFIGRVLDAHGIKIKSELDHAHKLRLEAEAILVLYKQKQAEFAKEAENILAKARADAEANTAQAQIELKAALDSRLKQALEKIAQEEASAIAEVRNHVVDITLAAARTMISEQMTNASQSELIKRAITDIDRKVH